MRRPLQTAAGILCLAAGTAALLIAGAPLVGVPIIVVGIVLLGLGTKIP